MKLTAIFPILQMLLCVGASTVYLLHRDWIHALYWALAGGITACVTLMR